MLLIRYVTFSMLLFELCDNIGPAWRQFIGAAWVLWTSGMYPFISDTLFVDDCTTFAGKFLHSTRSLLLCSANGERTRFSRVPDVLTFCAHKLSPHNGNDVCDTFDATEFRSRLNNPVSRWLRSTLRLIKQTSEFFARPSDSKSPRCSGVISWWLHRVPVVEEILCQLSSWQPL